MTWIPGMPVVTDQDVVDWQAWRKASKLEAQRYRRSKHPRIDYYPSEEALEIIRANSHNYVGGDHSSVINRIIQEWAEIPE